MENKKRALKAGKVQRSIKQLEKKVKRAEEAGDLEIAIDLLQEAHTLAEESGDLTHAARLLEHAITLADSLDEPLLRSALRNNLAMSHKRAGNFTQAKEALRQAIDLLKQAVPSIEASTIWNNLGYVERDMGNLKVALQCHETALDILGQINNSAGIGRTLTELGIVHKDMEQLTEARINFEQALTLLTEQDSLRDRGHALIGLGLTLEQFNDDKGSFHCYEEALDAYRQVGDRENEALALHNIGVLYDNKATSEEDLEIALAFYHQALEINKEIGAELGVADNLSWIAGIYQVRGDYEQAKEVHEQVLNMYEKMGFREGQVDTLVTLGMLARDSQDFNRAERNMSDALTLAQEIGNPRLVYEALLNRGDVYLLANKLHAAAEDYTAAATEVEAIRVNLLLEEEAIGFFNESRLEVYDRLVRLYARGLNSPEKAQMWVEQAKAREYLRRLRLSELLHTARVPQELLAQEALLLTQMKQAATALSEPDQQGQSFALEDYKAADGNLYSLWKKIESFDREYVSLRRGELVSWEEIKRLLKNS